MPTYEYECAACKHQWEVEAKISDTPAKKCPKCKKLRAKRLVSGGSGFILSGGCWSKDGYKST